MKLAMRGEGIARVQTVGEEAEIEMMPEQGSVRFGEVPGFAGFLLELSGFQMSVASCFCLCGCSLCCSSTRCLGLSAGLGSQFDCLQFFCHITKASGSLLELAFALAK